MNLYEQIKSIMIHTTKVDAESIRLDARLKADLGLDSLDCVEFGLELQNHFGFQIAIEDLQSFNTVEDVVNHIKDNM